MANGSIRRRVLTVSMAGAIAACAGFAVEAPAQGPPPAPAPTPTPTPPEFPPFAEVSKDYVQVVSTADGQASLYTLWLREKDGHMLAELPQGYQNQKHFIALTLASGDTYAGLHSGELYAYWRRYDKRLALIEPNIGTRSTGDDESKSSVERLFTDRVIVDVPIVAIGPKGQPVIDLDELLVQKAASFYGGMVRGMNGQLAAVKTHKAFPRNIEVAYEIPVDRGVLRTLHYSISLIPDSTGYQPRVADERVGYFATVYNDLGKADPKEQWVRYVNRWNLEKRDPSLKLSPPKRPIVFYIEHTTPVRYRRWVREGALMWNEAFEKVGILNAVEVEYQDKSTGANMDKDPENVDYNFIRWLNNNIGTAIGPSRVHPLTGEILDADIVLTDGWIRHFWRNFNEVLPEIAMEGFGPDTLTWLEKRPQWDPRLRLASPAQRENILAERAARGYQPYGGHPAAQVQPDAMLGGNEFDGLAHAHSQTNGLCMAATGKAMDMAIMRMTLDMMDPAFFDENAPEGEKKDTKDEGEKADLLDGIPDWFIGPLIADLVAHEVGHTLGLRHNFKSSSIYSLADINDPAMKGKKPFAGSVMDYIPININMKDGEIQGDYGMTTVGPYDHWAIEYGYTQEKDLKPILARVADPELVYATDEDTWGPDPLARRYDFAADPIAYAKSTMKLAKYHRERLLEKFVKDGESWSKARRGFDMSVGMQMRALGMMANWVGGAHVNRDKKGDPNARDPIVVVPVEKQREALEFCIQNTFTDDAFGLSPEMLAKMTLDKWWDEGGGDIFEEPTWPVHDRIMAIQASVLTMLINPTRLKRVYDNEFRTPQDEDALTLPELLETVSTSIWSEVAKPSEQKFTARQPMISSLRRNLQREHLERLIDLSMPGATFAAAYKPISNLATLQLRELKDTLAPMVEKGNTSKLDQYTLAHLAEAHLRIEKALDAQYIYNADAIGGGGSGGFMFFGQGRQAPATER